MGREIDPIRNDVDYYTALKEIERLWSAKEGTPESDRLEVLARLVERMRRNTFLSRRGAFSKKP